jgi:hypothetical protein
MHRYFVYEQFERFTSTVASRPGAWWYFVPIVLLGLFPWTGFLWAGLRDAVRGGWADRAKNADTWFFLTWAGFIFLFFSASHSKLPPYILPVFPALAVLIGRQLAPAFSAGSPGPRGGLVVFSLFCGLLAVALCAVVMRPGFVHGMSAPQAEALRPPAFAMAAVLLLGGVLAPWLAGTRGPRAALGAVVATLALFCGVLTYAAADIQKPGTKELALLVRTLAQPGDRVMHYHEFFHDFTFYARRVVDVVAFKGELELVEDAAARASGRFLDDAAFRRLWPQPGRVFAVARKRDVTELFADPAFSYHLLGQTEDHYLFSNQP